MTLVKAIEAWAPFVRMGIVVYASYQVTHDFWKSVLIAYALAAVGARASGKN